MDLASELRKGITFPSVRDQAANLLESQAERIAELEAEVDGFCKKLRRSSQFEYQARRLLNPDLISLLDMAVKTKLGTGGGTQ